VSRVNLKVGQPTRERLRELKREHESWDDLLNRLAEYGELVERDD